MRISNVSDFKSLFFLLEMSSLVCFPLFSHPVSQQLLLVITTFQIHFPFPVSFSWPRPLLPSHTRPARLHQLPHDSPCFLCLTPSTQSLPVHCVQTTARHRLFKNYARQDSPSIFFASTPLPEKFLVKIYFIFKYVYVEVG